MIRTVDENGDGKINYQEFRVMIGAKPNLRAQREAQKAAETLISHIDVMKTDLRVVQSQCPGDMLQLEEHNDDLEKEAIGMANEAQVLKKSAPEGNVEDSNVQMYLAIAELEKTNSILRQQQKITQG